MKIILATSVAALMALLFLFPPQVVSWYPRCPVLVLTGYKCPGCGSLRGISALLHGNILAAWRFNPLMVASIPYLLLGVYVQALSQKGKLLSLRKNLLGGTAAKMWLVIIVVYVVLRNWLGW